jgi:hypothetical protein
VDTSTKLYSLYTMQPRSIDVYLPGSDVRDRQGSKREARRQVFISPACAGWLCRTLAHRRRGRWDRREMKETDTATTFGITRRQETGPSPRLGLGAPAAGASSRKDNAIGFVCRSHDKTPALTRHAAAGPSPRLWHRPRRPPVWRVGSTVGEGDLFGRCNPGLDDGWTRGEDNSQACPGGGPIPCGCRPVKSAAIATATWCSSHARRGIPRHGTRGDM